MTNLRPVAYSMGLVMFGVALMLGMLALVDIVDGNTDWWHFISAARASSFIGGVTVAASWERGPAGAHPSPGVSGDDLRLDRRVRSCVHPVSRAQATA